MPRVGGLPFPENTVVRDINPFGNVEKLMTVSTVTKYSLLETLDEKIKMMEELCDFVKNGPGKQVILGAVPAKSNCYRIVTFKSKDPLKKSYSHLAKTKELNEYEKSFTLQCIKYRNLRVNAKFRIEIDVWFRQQRSDLDNAAKVILDMLQKVSAIDNDNLLYELVMRKHIDKENPRIEFQIQAQR